MAVEGHSRDGGSYSCFRNTNSFRGHLGSCGGFLKLGLQRAWGIPEKGPMFCCISKAHLILKFCSLTGKAVSLACSHSQVILPAPGIHRPSVQSLNFLMAGREGWSLSSHPFPADTHRMAPRKPTCPPGRRNSMEAHRPGPRECVCNYLL